MLSSPNNAELSRRRPRLGRHEAREHRKPTAPRKQQVWRLSARVKSSPRDFH